MWGGVYAVLFSISTLLSFENPIKNGFTENPAEGYAKYSLSNVEFQDKIVGKEIQYSLYENKKFGPLQRGQSISITDQGGIWAGYGFISKVKLSANLDFVLRNDTRKSNIIKTSGLLEPGDYSTSEFIEIESFVRHPKEFVNNKNVQWILNS